MLYNHRLGDHTENRLQPIRNARFGRLKRTETDRLSELAAELLCCSAGVFPALTAG